MKKVNVFIIILSCISTYKLYTSECPVKVYGCFCNWGNAVWFRDSNVEHCDKKCAGISWFDTAKHNFCDQKFIGARAATCPQNASCKYELIDLGKYSYGAVFATPIALAALSPSGKAFISKDSGVNWQRVVGNFISIVFMPSGSLYAVTSLGQLYVSKNAGVSWQNIPGISLKRLGVVYSERLVAIDSTDKIKISFDGGKTWSTVDGNFKQVTEAPDTSLFAINSTNKLVQSTDNGGSWKDISPQETPSFVAVSHENIIWIIALGDEPKYSTDGGTTWVTATGAWNTKLVNVSTALNDRVFGSNKNGEAFISINRGRNWIRMGNLSYIIAAPNNALFKLLPSNFGATYDKAVGAVYTKTGEYTLECTDLKAGIECVKKVAETVTAYLKDTANKEIQQKLISALMAYCTYRNIDPETPAKKILEDVTGFVAFIKKNENGYKKCGPTFLEALASAVKDKAQEFGESALSAVTNPEDAAEAVFSAVSGPIINLSKAAINAAKQTMNAAQQASANAASSAISSITNTVVDIASKLKFW